MKCDFCGANLTIDDEVCPYCHTPNTHYVKHREDMHRYEQDYQSTKTEVYETAGKTSKKATQIAVLAGTAVSGKHCDEQQYLDD